MKDNVWVIMYVILGSIAALMVVSTLIMLNDRGQFQTPCEELIKINNDNTYAPLPKRCEKGE